MLLENGILITVDDNGTVLPEGSILVRGDRILDLGPREEMHARYPDEPVVPLEGKIVIPGLVDCHVHLEQPLFRGCADNLPLLDWLQNCVWPCQAALELDDVVAAASVTIYEMLRSGTTTFVETLTGVGCAAAADAVAELILRSGIRGVLPRVVMGGPSRLPERLREHPELCLSEVLRLHARYHGAGDGRLSIGLGLRTPFRGADPEVIRRATSLAAAEDLVVSVHFMETTSEREAVKAETGLAPAAFAASVGLLRPKTFLVHGVHLDEGDFDLLASSGATVVHCPSANLKLASGIARVWEMLAAGVNVGLGCDGAPCNNTYDMLQEMKIAALAQRGRLGAADVLPAERVLRMATIDGARALGLADRIGSLEKGKKADLVVIDVQRSHLSPNVDPISSVVWCATGQDVDMVFVDGKEVVVKGEVVTLPAESQLARELAERSRSLLARAGVVPNRY